MLRSLAQVGTLVVVVSSLVSCTSETDLAESAGDGGGRLVRDAALDATNAGDAGASADAAPGDAARDANGETTADSCARNSDCTLVPVGCCAACLPTSADVRAMTRASAAAITPCGAACGPCAEPSWSQLLPALRAACVAGACKVVDLRAEALTACTSDSECEAREAESCSSCTSLPSGFVPVRKGAVDFTRPDPFAGACPPCAPMPPPPAFCAIDGHCALREPPRVKGAVSDSCVSPFSNIDQALQPGSIGCDCSPDNDSTCVQSDAGPRVRLGCQSGSWKPALGGC